MGYVYLIKSSVTDKFKIGITKQNINKRLKSLQTGNSEKLELIYYYESDFYTKIEKTLHNQFSHNRLEGEWFNLSFEESFHFKKRCEKIEENLRFLNDNKIG